MASTGSHIVKPLRVVLGILAAAYFFGFMNGILGLALRFEASEVFVRLLDQATSHVLPALPKFHLLVTGGNIYVSFFLMLLVCTTAEWALARWQLAR